MKASRRTLLALALSAPLALASLAGSADAAFVTCKTDPTVTLSNGAQITLYALTQDTIADVTGVTYNLHGPAGTSITSIVYDRSASIEHVTYSADQGGGRYKAFTTVSTAHARVKTTINASVHSLACSQPPKSNWGWTNTTISLAFVCN